MFTDSFHHLYTSRFFIGISLGFMMTISPIYIAEVATQSQRGQCISFLSFNNVLGSIIAITSFHILSYFQYNWKWSFLFPMLLICIQLYIIAFLPDSPRWLLAKKTPSDCSVSLQTFRRSPDISREFNILYRALSSDARLGDSWLEIILSKTIRIRLFITMLLQIIPQFIGIQMILFFGYEIMKEMNIQQIFMSILLIYISGLFGTMMLFYYIEKKGRHLLLAIGNNAIGVIWIVLSCIVYLKIGYLTPTNTSNSDATTHSPSTESIGHEYMLYAIKIGYLFFLCLFYAIYYFSWGSIGWIYSAEIFPYRARAKAMSITTSVHYLSALLASQLLQVELQSDDDVSNGGGSSISQPINDDVLMRSSSGGSSTIGFYQITTYFDLHNIAQCFLILGFTCFFVNIVIFLMIPETSGLMIEEMEEVFKIEHLSYCCGCIPRYRRQFHLPYNSSILRSGSGMVNYSSLGTTTPYSMLDADGNGDARSDEDNTIYEPKLLHKYSRDMKESKFTYYHESKSSHQISNTSQTPVSDRNLPGSASKWMKDEREQKFQRSKERFNLIPDDTDHNTNTTSTVNTYTDFICHSDEGSEGGSGESDQESGDKNKIKSLFPKIKAPFGSATKSKHHQSAMNPVFSLPPPGSSSMRRYHSSSFSSVPNSSSKKSQSSTLSAIGTTLYETLFNSGNKRTKDGLDSTTKSTTGSVRRNQHHQQQRFMRNNHSEEEDYNEEDENEEHFEPLIESFAMKLPFHDK
eukprot:gene4038-4322_t